MVGGGDWVAGAGGAGDVVVRGGDWVAVAGGAGDVVGGAIGL